MGDFLTRDEILSIKDVPFEDVEVPEWGGKKVRVYALTIAAKNAYEESIQSIRDGQRTISMEHATAKLLVRCLGNDQGTLLFSENDILALGAKSAKTMDRLATIALRLSGMLPSSLEDAKKN